MKILLAATTSEMSSGATRCLIELAEQLILNEVDVIVTIPRPGEIEGVLNSLGIKYYCVHEYHSWYTSAQHQDNNFFLKKIFNIKTIMHVASIIRKEKVDIVHMNALTAYTSAYAAVITRRKLVWHMREFMEEGLKISFYNTDFSTRLINRSAKLIAVSTPIGKRGEQLFTAPTVVIPDGLPVENYYIAWNDKIKQKTIKIVIYGRVGPVKRQLDLFKAFDLVKDNLLVPVHIYWAGRIEDEDYYHKIKKYISEHQLESCTSYLGEITDVRELLRDKQITCVCSNEAFGRVTVESMLANTLVVGANLGGTSEIITHLENGILYNASELSDFGEKLKDAINHYENYQGVIQKAQQHAISNYSLEMNAERILAIYSNLIEKK